MELITKAEIFERVRKANGLRGRQRITEYWSDGADEWIFGTNAKGGYGETITLHYATDKDLLRDIAPERKAMRQKGFFVWELV
jgi:hypothetical protein